ncbi:ABC transporter permease YtrF [Lachnospiraceae bacterium]|nr:ABC transporter permease YtrF [Lachnospiraceae bacterium]
MTTIGSMWKNYSIDYIKNNRASGISIIAASFIAALFLSFLCCLFYNFWLDNIEGTKLEDGSWHGRITGEISGDELAAINNFANVEKAVVNEELSGEQGTVVDVYFYNKRTVYQDMSALVNILGLAEDAANYNYQLLSLYFVRIPGDNMPRLLMPAYLAIVMIVCFSLILVIHNSFAASMNSRVHQFGIFSSIGATPGQIRTCLVQEALFLSIVPIMAGILLGIIFSFGTVWGMNAFAANFAGGRQASFSCHPVILILVLFLSILTVLVSAWLPARKLSRLTPLESIRGTDELQLKKKTHSPVLSALFGIEGEMAGNALKAQKKALRTTSLSLMLAFLGFMIMQCFWTLSGISTNHTYFEKYQDAWDVMATVKDTHIEDFGLINELQGMPKVDSSVVYQKAEAVCILPQDAQSKELLALGGLEVFLGDATFYGKGLFQIKAPIFILDDESFGEFCGQIGIASRMDGTIVLNRLWDSVNSNFRYPEYIPYVKENMEAVALNNAAEKGDENMVKIPVLACTKEYPLLREEYGKSDCPLVQFMPLSLWKEIGGQIGGAEQDTYVRVLANDRTEVDILNALENEITQIIGSEYEIECENRIQEREDNNKMIEGYELILGSFCVLLAIIGIAHVFSHTLGFLRQRKREFARYMSVGLTPEGIRKMFFIEALMIAGRPLLVTSALTIVAVAFMIRASCLDPMEFIKVAPIAPILAFVSAVFAFVALAYYLGGKKILKVSLAEALRDDTMM